MDKIIFEALDKVRPDDAAYNRMLGNILTTAALNADKPPVKEKWFKRFAPLVVACAVVVGCIPLIWNLVSTDSLEGTKESYIAEVSGMPGDNNPGEDGIQAAAPGVSTENPKGDSSPQPSGSPDINPSPSPESSLSSLGSAVGENSGSDYNPPMVGANPSGANTPSPSQSTKEPSPTKPPSPAGTPSPTAIPEPTVEPNNPDLPSSLKSEDINGVDSQTINSDNHMDSSGIGSNSGSSVLKHADAVVTGTVETVQLVRYTTNSGKQRYYTLATVYVDSVLMGQAGGEIKILSDCIADTRKSVWDISGTFGSSVKIGAALREGQKGIFAVSKWNADNGFGIMEADPISGMILETGIGLVYSDKSYNDFSGSSFENAVEYIQDKISKEFN